MSENTLKSSTQLVSWPIVQMMANKRRNRNDTAKRLLRVIGLLETNPNGVTFQRLLNTLNDEGFDLSERTLYRDLSVIEEVHFPLVRQESSGQGAQTVYRFHRTTALGERVHFDHQELFALFLARESLASLKGSPLIDSVLSMTQKLETLLGPSVKQELKNLAHTAVFRASASWHTKVPQEILDTIYAATYERSLLEVDYRSAAGPNAGQIKRRRLGPESLYFADGGAYLVARDMDDGKIKNFSLSRFTYAEMTPEEYVPTENFDLESHIGSQFGVLDKGEHDTVVLDFREPIASYISERGWHSSQRLTRTTSGLRLEMKVSINEELARWVLSFASYVRIVSPPALRTECQRLAQTLLNEHTDHERAS